MQRAMTMTVLMAAMGMPMACVAAEVSVHNQMLMADFPGPGHAGYLGVGLKDVSDDRVAALKLKDARGVEVIALDHDGPAAKVGIREHDVILDMNGQEVASEEQLRRMLRETPAGRKAELTLSRDGQEVKVEVVLGDRAQSAHVMPDMENLNVQLEGLNNIVPANGVIEFDNMDLGNGPLVFGPTVSGASVETLGAQLAEYFGAKDGKGVLVKEVRHDSAAAKAGLRAGDVIVKAGGQAVASRGDWERVTRQNRGKAVGVEILRDKHLQKLSITPPARTQGEVGPEMAPTSFVIEDDEDAGPEMMAAMQEAQNPETQKELQQEMEKARAEMAASAAEVGKAMAEVKAQMSSPEFKKEMEEAQRRAQQAAAEWQKNMPELKKQLAEAQAEAQRQAQTASAEWAANGPAMQAQMAQARAEAEKAAAEWKAQQPQMEQQLREAQEQMKKAAEEMRQQLTPMD
jgi:membrane-associated protease RseP (regulator of RpoE activity)